MEGKVKFPEGIWPRLDAGKLQIAEWHTEIFEMCDVRLRITRDTLRERMVSGLMTIGYTREESEETLVSFEVNSFIMGAAVAKLHGDRIKLLFEKAEKKEMDKSDSTYFG